MGEPGFPPGFFTRFDESPDARFYEPPRFVRHLDDRAVDAVGGLYEALGIDGSADHPVRVLDLMSSWVSHFRVPPAELVALGMNADELAANEAATSWLVHDLNEQPSLPFPDGRFDAVTCCVSIDYLVHPIEVLQDVARVVVPGGIVAITFSNRCFPTKAIRGWLGTTDEQHCWLVAEYLRRAGGWSAATVALLTPPGPLGDPLYGVWATRT